jgi:electron transfer flavoprotein alpha subunit
VRAAGLDGVQADRIVEALARALAGMPGAIVLFAQTFDARLIAPRLAARINAAIVMNCTDVQASGDALDATVTAFGGDTRAVYRCAGAGPFVFSIGANAVAAEPLDGEQRAPQVRDVDVDVSGVGERVRVVERPQASVGPRLEHAQVVVAGGRGLGVPENFKLVEELAAALGGMAAASRPIVDDGWAKPAQQVGLTGKITKPALYIAAGISGASQHMVGCAAAKTLIAINRDKDAAIFRYARYGVVGDCVEILPALTEAVRAARKG